MPDFAGLLPKVINHVTFLIVDWFWNCIAAGCLADCRERGGSSAVVATLIEPWSMQSSKRSVPDIVTLMLLKVPYLLKED